MTIYVLILFAHVGALGDGNSNALTTAEFTSIETCQDAGKAAMTLASGSVKKINFVCTKK